MKYRIRKVGNYYYPQRRFLGFLWWECFWVNIVPEVSEAIECDTYQEAESFIQQRAQCI